MQEKSILTISDPFAYPYLGVTVNVDNYGLNWETKNGRLFFLSFSLARGKSANAIPEFRQRIDGDSNHRLSKCMTSHTVAKADGTYPYCSLDPEKSFEDFLPFMPAPEVKLEGGDLVENGGNFPSYFFISTLRPGFLIRLLSYSPYCFLRTAIRGLHGTGMGRN